jgi:glutamine amidotransferase
MISILKLNSGNINSIINMLKHIGCYNYKIINEKNEIAVSEKIIMPGVGHFGETMRFLKKNDLVSTLKHTINEKKIPILGICVGAQIMLNNSEEDEHENGLQLLNGRCKKFDIASTKISLHMGWNKLCLKKQKSLFEADDKFYFCHSYYIDTLDQENVLSTTNFGNEFISSFQKENILGVQFHIEKSHRYGMSFLNKFVNNFYV